LGDGKKLMLSREDVIRVCADPVVDLFVEELPGPIGRPLLVIHGGPDWDHSYLRDPLVRLAGRHRVLLPDLRGCGRSTRGLPDAEYRWDAVVADLLSLLDARRIPVADVVGFSTGGMIAQRLVLAAPHRVRRLVVASSSVLPIPPGAFGGWRERDSRQATTVSEPEPAGLTGPALTRAWALSSAPANVWREDRLPQYLRRLETIRFSAEWMRPWQAGLLPPALPMDAASRLAKLGLPILLLHGRQDMIFPVSLALDAAHRMASARSVVLDQAGHMAHIDQPERWLAELAEFLA
jgi:pimeloyl-ACP methyl ester carboxylesterase